MASTQIRQIEEADYPLLEEFLYHAIFLPPGAAAPPREVIFEPEIFIYIEDFGGRDDCGVVAQQNGRVVGAAWTRIIPGFGHVDDRTPELAVSVLPGCRGHMIGTMLMTRLFAVLRGRGYSQTSLAVQQKSGAVNFYQRLGYAIVNKSDAEFIMLKKLDDCSCQAPHRALCGGQN